MTMNILVIVIQVNDREELNFFLLQRKITDVYDI